MGSGGRAVERRTVNRGDGDSIPSTAISKLRQFRSPHICLCLSEETLKAGGPFYGRAHTKVRRCPPEGATKVMRCPPEGMAGLKGKVSRQWEKGDK